MTITFTLLEGLQKSLSLGLIVYFVDTVLLMTVCVLFFYYYRKVLAAVSGNSALKRTNASSQKQNSDLKRATRYAMIANCRKWKCFAVRK